MKAGTMKTGALKRDAGRKQTADAGFGPSGSASVRHGAPAAVSGTQDVGGHVRGPFRHDVDAFEGNAEPAMVDVLNEPIVRSVMYRDGVAMDTLQAILRKAESLVALRPRIGQNGG